MKILVTGTAGFIGFHLMNNLVKQGHDVVGLDVINDYYDVNLKKDRLAQVGISSSEIAYNKLVKSSLYPQLSFIQLDLTDDSLVHQLFESQGFDYVCHLAAQAGVRYSITNPKAYIDSNIISFLTILEGCRQFNVKHLVYASSSSVYGSNTKMPFSVHDNVDHPISLYAATKKSNELMAHSYSHLYQIPTTGLRFFTAYGPWGRPDMALFLFTKAIIQGEPIDVYNNGQMRRDFTYIDDIVSGVSKVLGHIPKSDSMWDNFNSDPSTSSAPYKIFNIGNNSPVRLLDFILAIESALGKKAIMNMLPLQLGDVPASHADAQSLIDAVGYAPNTTIEEGIQSFIAWYLSYYKVTY